MKLWLNLALTAALAWGTSACTVVTDPSSGSSSGGSSSTSFMDRQQQISQFASVNLEQLRNDMAAGQGEYLGSLATLLDVDASQQAAFFAMTRDKFTALFPSDHTTASEMLTTLNREMHNDPRFGQRLALN